MNSFHFAKSMTRAVALLGGAVALVSSLAATPMGHIRGTIVSVTADKLIVRTPEGNETVAIEPTTRISGIVPSSLDQIKAGTFVGIANIPGGGTSKAMEVVVFPDSMKGTGLGDYPWDLAPKSGGAGKASAMTNGTVTAAGAGGAAKSSAMTNGTVKSAAKGSGLMLTVDYGKGEKKIQVPAGVPVVGIVPADASKLVPGAHVFVATKKDAPQTAAFVAVGVDGAVPPM